MPSVTGTAAASATPGAATTPVIIASATPTATPVTHVVQAGETLLSIALDFGVSLDALQLANPSVQPRFLSIGTVLLIPPPEGGAAAVATNLAPPPPAPIDMGQPACFVQRSGALYCFVEARNGLATPVENVAARLTLAGLDGLPFASAIAYAAVDLIPAGAAAPLAVVFAPAPTQSIAATGVEVLTADPADSAVAQGRVVALDVPAQTASASGPHLSLSGQVHNGSSQTLTGAWVVVTLYDKGGQVIGYRKLALAGGLGPGEAREFALEAEAVSGVVDHYAILGEGHP
jgi:LysM repeat protein